MDPLSNAQTRLPNTYRPWRIAAHMEGVFDGSQDSDDEILTEEEMQGLLDDAAQGVHELEQGPWQELQSEIETLEEKLKEAQARPTAEEYRNVCERLVDRQTLLEHHSNQVEYLQKTMRRAEEEYEQDLETKETELRDMTCEMETYWSGRQEHAVNVAQMSLRSKLDYEHEQARQEWHEQKITLENREKRLVEVHKQALEGLEKSLEDKHKELQYLEQQAEQQKDELRTANEAILQLQNEGTRQKAELQSANDQIKDLCQEKQQQSNELQKATKRIDELQMEHEQQQERNKQLQSKTQEQHERNTQLQEEAQQQRERIDQLQMENQQQREDLQEVRKQITHLQDTNHQQHQASQQATKRINELQGNAQQQIEDLQKANEQIIRLQGDIQQRTTQLQEKTQEQSDELQKAEQQIAQLQDQKQQLDSDLQAAKQQAKKLNDAWKAEKTFGQNQYNAVQKAHREEMQEAWQRVGVDQPEDTGAANDVRELVNRSRLFMSNLYRGPMQSVFQRVGVTLGAWPSLEQPTETYKDAVEVFLGARFDALYGKMDSRVQKAKRSRARWIKRYIELRSWYLDVKASRREYKMLLDRYIAIEAKHREELEKGYAHMDVIHNEAKKDGECIADLGKKLREARHMVDTLLTMNEELLGEEGVAEQA